jgi:hypothetical protein
MGTVESVFTQWAGCMKSKRPAMDSSFFRLSIKAGTLRPSPDMKTVELEMVSPMNMRLLAT